MRHRARYLLAVTLVATALCADRAMAAVPEARPQIGQLAEKLAARLSRSFGRTASTRIVLTERASEGTPTNHEQGVVAQVARPQSLLSVYQFRLPPPSA